MHRRTVEGSTLMTACALCYMLKSQRTHPALVNRYKVHKQPYDTLWTSSIRYLHGDTVLNDG